MGRGVAVQVWVDRGYSLWMWGACVHGDGVTVYSGRGGLRVWEALYRLSHIHTSVRRAWTRVWDDAVDPPTWHVGDSLAYRLANHWDLTPKQDCPLKMGEEGPRCGEGCGRGGG